MDKLPTLLYTAEQTRTLDKIAIEEYGIPGIVLMERAGQAAFNLMMHRWPKVRKIAVLCGGGNNGGDGFVVARLAHLTGLSVSLYTLSDPEKLQGEAKQAYQALSSLSLEPKDRLPASLSGYELIIDGLLGTGLNAEVSGRYTQAISLINRSKVPVLALDLPSGLNADSGQVMGGAVQADVTISFIGLNRGLLTGDGPGYVGALHFADLEVPVGVYESISSHVGRVDYESLKAHIPPRPQHVHKGMCGHLLLVGGDQGMSGAIRLAGEAALRSGSGLVSLATRESHAGIITAQRPELMCHGLEHQGDLQPLMDRADVVVCGPGLGQASWGTAMFQQLLAGKKTLVLDADALNLLAKQPQHRDDWLLTPHPGEAARLLGSSPDAVNGDRFTAIQALQKRYGGYVLLKGAGTLMCDPKGDITLCSDGNSGMASGGMGDVLSGVLGALLAQDIPPAVAIKLGVAIHAAAGDLAAAEQPRGLLASDLFPYLRELVNPV